MRRLRTGLLLNSHTTAQSKAMNPREILNKISVARCLLECPAQQPMHRN